MICCFFFVVCEMCEYEFKTDNDSNKRSLSDEEEDDDEENYDDAYYDDDDETYEVSMPQNKDKKRKPIEAVEKAMTDDEITSYYNQYISVLKDQRQQTTNTNSLLRGLIDQLRSKELCVALLAAWARWGAARCAQKDTET